MFELTERYADLLREDDPATTRLVMQLDRLLSGLDLPAHLRQPVVAPAASITRSASWPRVRWSAVAAAAVLLLTGATLAGSTLLATVWQRDRGLDHVYAAGLVTELQLTETAGGVTVKLERAYGDANRIAVGLTVIGSPPMGANVSVPPQSIHLRTADGTDVPQLAGSGYADGRSPYGAQVIVFDAAPLSTRAEEQFQLLISEVRAPSGSAAGPWRFTFPLRIISAEVRTAIIEAGSGVTAQLRVQATPSETRLYVTAEDAEGRPWTATVVSLVADGQRYSPSWGRCGADGACPLFVFSELLEGRTAWIVAIDGFERADRNKGSVVGPWQVVLR